MIRTAIILVCTLIAGCASTTNQPENQIAPELRWEQQQKNNSAISSWMLKGKIGVNSGGKGGSATLNWTYFTDSQDIELYGPFGGGRVMVATTADSAVLKDTVGRIIEGESAEQVLYQRLGWQVPFKQLIMWARGLPNEGATDIQIDEYGQLASLNQGIWHVEYQEYRMTQDLNLPRKLTITSLPGTMEITDDNGSYIGDTLTVKVILKRWQNIEIN